MKSGGEAWCGLTAPPQGEGSDENYPTFDSSEEVTSVNRTIVPLELP